MSASGGCGGGVGDGIGDVCGVLGGGGCEGIGRWL